jgi:phosphoribosylanthranilate isomerase
MWVKICGNTNLEDAALAAQLGADAVGFVFAAGKRQMTAAQVAAITAHLADTVERVGVFDTRDAEAIAQTASAAGLTAVQLHGGLDEGLIEALAKRLAGRVRIIQTLHWTIGEKMLHGEADATATAESSAVLLAGQIRRVAAQGIVDRILIDSKVGGAGGGTGVAYDWSAAKGVFASAPNSVHLIVAGGLKPDNIACAIAQLEPWGVDVSSGVEESPRRKDPARVERFIENARGSETP